MAPISCPRQLPWPPRPPSTVCEDSGNRVATCEQPNEINRRGMPITRSSSNTTGQVGSDAHFTGMTAYDKLGSRQAPSSSSTRCTGRDESRQIGAIRLGTLVIPTAEMCPQLPTPPFCKEVSLNLFFFCLCLMFYIIYSVWQISPNLHSHSQTILYQLLIIILILNLITFK